ncbi:hypothetical protein [Natranaerobius thermophilus]|uniref:Uncharacterized protein n=1 Tax=Natranaerobius thermophilus (strain ATCC BAA-1301 / DSM 18059 / JW/NM-WN-LF) TaxID=457570 RepID=B2A3D4_NATTJ|nr:hypothetical protein [Natranaerobius thermophilus]ACB86363.1 hypothetical protein Nther_2815 [Natranaerobius thermophilus JW/NM-WN-LF]
MSSQEFEFCQACGREDKESLENYMVRKNFAFGKNFPIEYEEMSLCIQCRENYERKNSRMKVLAVIVLAVILIFMGINFTILISPAIF